MNFSKLKLWHWIGIAALIIIFLVEFHPIFALVLLVIIALFILYFFKN